MLGSDILEVFMGLGFLFALLSLASTAAREVLESILKSRGRTLKRAVDAMLGQAQSNKLYDHDMVRGLYRRTPQEQQNGPWRGRLLQLVKARDLPSYIPSRTFAIALLDSLQVGLLSNPADMRKLASTSSTPAGPNPRGAVRAAIETAGYDPERTRFEIAAWYDAAMDRASGWYKRQTQLWLLVIATTLTLLLNIDALRIAQYLYRNSAERAALIAQIESRGANSTPPDVDGIRRDIQRLDLPLYWSSDFFNPDGSHDWSAILDHAAGSPLIGWLLSILAISLGAPFWFDLLNRFMVIRATVKPFEKGWTEGHGGRAHGRRDGFARPPFTGWTPLPLPRGPLSATAGSGPSPAHGAEGILQ